MNLKNTIRQAVNSARARKWAASAIVVCGLAVVPLGVPGWLSSLAGRSAHAETVAPTAGGSVFTDEQKKALGDVIKDYLVKNPEVMLEVQTALDAKMEKEQSEKLKSFMAENGKSIYRSPNSSLAGNPNGDITVVEFFDYNCGYCKRGLPDVHKLIDDKKVRVVFKELPILSKGSEEAAKVAIAAKRQGKYWDFHQAMLELQGPGQRGHRAEGRRSSASIWRSSRPTWQAMRSRTNSAT